MANNLEVKISDSRFVGREERRVSILAKLNLYTRSGKQHVTVSNRHQLLCFAFQFAAEFACMLRSQIRFIARLKCLKHSLSYEIALYLVCIYSRRKKKIVVDAKRSSSFPQLSEVHRILEKNYVIASQVLLNSYQLLIQLFTSRPVVRTGRPLKNIIRPYRSNILRVIKRIHRVDSSVRKTHGNIFTNFTSFDYGKLC